MKKYTVLTLSLVSMLLVSGLLVTPVAASYKSPSATQGLWQNLEKQIQLRLIQSDVPDNLLSLLHGLCVRFGEGGNNPPTPTVPSLGVPAPRPT